MVIKFIPEESGMGYSLCVCCDAIVVVIGEINKSGS